MAKGIYVGVSSKARKVKKMYFGVGGKARKVKKAYIGIGGKARPFFSSEPELSYYGSITGLSEARRFPGGGNNGNYALFYGGINGSNTSSKVVNAYSKTLVRTIITAAVDSHLSQGISSPIYAVFNNGLSNDVNSFGGTYAYDNSLTRSAQLNDIAWRYSYSGKCMAGSNYIYAGGTVYRPYAYGGMYQASIIRAYTSSLARVASTPEMPIASPMTGTQLGTNGIFAHEGYTGVLSSSLVLSSPASLSLSRAYPVAASNSSYAVFAGGVYASAETDYVEAYGLNHAKIIPARLTKNSTYSRYPFDTSTPDFAVMLCGNIAETASYVDYYDINMVKKTHTINTRWGDCGGGVIGDFIVYAGGFEVASNTPVTSARAFRS